MGFVCSSAFGYNEKVSCFAGVDFTITTSQKTILRKGTHLLWTQNSLQWCRFGCRRGVVPDGCAQLENEDHANNVCAGATFQDEGVSFL